MSIRKKLYTLFVACIFGIYLSVVSVAAHQMRALVRDYNAENMEVICKRKVNAINSQMESAERAVKVMENYIFDKVDFSRFTTDAVYRERFMEEFSPFAKEAANIAVDTAAVYFRLEPTYYGGQGGVFIVDDGAGKFINVIPTNILQYASNDRERVGWYYEPKENGRPMWMEPYSNKNINVYMISYVSPLFIEGQFLGVVGIDMKMSTIHRVIDSIEYEEGFGFLLGQRGGLVYHPEYPAGLSAIQFNDELTAASEFLLKEKGADKIGTYKWHDEKQYLIGGEMINGMILAISVSRAQVIAPLVKIRTTMLLILVGISIVAAFAIYLIMRHVVNPIAELTNAASRIAKGELNFPIRYKSSDEIGFLADSIRKMGVELKEYISYIHTQAYTDAMTGVRNKAAYMDEIRVLERKINAEMADFAIVVFDVNGLKQINDNMGHEIGDALITDAAYAIREAFGDDCVFRIGGDEFIVVKEKISQNVLNGFIEDFKKNLTDINNKERSYDTPLSISMGFTFYDDDKDYKTVFKRADEAMYFNKQEFYKGRRDRRSH